MDFQFATASRIVFGRGSIKQLPELVATGTQLLVTGAHPERYAAQKRQLELGGSRVVGLTITSEPKVGEIKAAVELARQEGVSGVIGLGGGSVLDAGKAISALVANPGEPLDYLEVIGQGKKLTHQPLRYVAAPTTAGTGAEVTKNAVLASPEHGVKVSLRSDSMLPDVALVDPELTHSVPADVTAATGLDALTQVLEPYVSCFANPLTDAICVEGIRRAARSLERAFLVGDDADARQDMALTSLFGGLALANAKLGAVHGFAGPLGGMFEAPHGAICARLLPIVMEANVRALEQRGDQRYLQRYQQVAALLTGSPTASIGEGIAWVQSLWERMRIPALSSYGMTSTDVPVAVSKAARASSMKGNPIELTEDELTSIVKQAL